MSAAFESGFSVREASWHGMATVLEDYPASREEAKAHAGHNWEPIPAPAYEYEGVTADGTVTGDAAEAVAGDYRPVKGKTRILRSDNRKTLAVTNETYSIIGNDVMYDVAEEMYGMGLKYETGGVLEEGRSVWLLICLDEPITLPGDTSLTLPYVALLNRHDGMGSLSAIGTMVRVICRNTWHASEVEGQRNGTAFSFRHTKNWRDRVDDAKAVVAGLRTDVEKYKEAFGHLLEVPVTEVQRERFITEFIPMPPQGLISDRVARNVTEAQNAVRLLLAGPTCAGIEGTAYGLVQAAGEYADHIRRYRTKATYFNRTVLSNEPLKASAMKLALAVAKS